MKRFNNLPGGSFSAIETPSVGWPGGLTDRPVPCKGCRWILTSHTPKGKVEQEEKVREQRVNMTDAVPCGSTTSRGGGAAGG